MPFVSISRALYENCSYKFAYNICFDKTFKYFLVTVTFVLIFKLADNKKSTMNGICDNCMFKSQNRKQITKLFSIMNCFYYTNFNNKNCYH